MRMTEERFKGIGDMTLKDISMDNYAAFFEMYVELYRYRQLEDEGNLVEIVQCKDCYWWRESEKTNHMFCEHDTDAINVERYANNFCSYGYKQSGEG